MKSKSSDKANRLARRKARVRKKVNGTSERPRMSVFRSARHVLVQVIDDSIGQTLACIGSMHLDKSKRASIDVCTLVGKRIAERCKEKNIHKIVFDKNGRDYHGRVKAVAEGAREGGLDF